MSDKKYVAVLSRKCEPGRAMNVVGHMTAGLVGSREEEWGIDDYADADGSPHIASRYPFIILKAKNSNKIRAFREALIEAGVSFTSFTDKMLVGTWQEQMEASKVTKEEDMEYFGVCAFGDPADIDPLTKKFSLWQ